MTNIFDALDEAIPAYIDPDEIMLLELIELLDDGIMNDWEFGFISDLEERKENNDLVMTIRQRWALKEIWEKYI